MPLKTESVFPQKADPDLCKILSRFGLRSEEVIQHAVSDLDSSGNTPVSSR